MRTLFVRNVNDAWQKAIQLIDQAGVEEDSRNGKVRVAPWPVVTIYDKPTERVLFDPVRDANPIFHLHEALWMLAGEQDATWLDQFVSDFSERFAEEDGNMHGAYGYRWREHFENVNSYRGGPIDQLDWATQLLFEDPKSRQVVIQMWDVESDLGTIPWKDRPCNTHIYLRINAGQLDLCTMCRSNDIVWGAYGANAVHFTILQEYLAARIGIPVGKYTQFSWNWHLYDSTNHLVDHVAANEWPAYPGTLPIVTVPEVFDEEVKAYIIDPDSAMTARNTFLDNTARAMWMANVERRTGDYEQALRWAHTIEAPDWQMATVAWLKRRIKK